MLLLVGSIKFYSCCLSVYLFTQSKAITDRTDTMFMLFICLSIHTEQGYNRQNRYNVHVVYLFIYSHRARLYNRQNRYNVHVVYLFIYSHRAKIQQTEQIQCSCCLSVYLFTQSKAITDRTDTTPTTPDTSRRSG